MDLSHFLDCSGLEFKRSLKSFINRLLNSFRSSRVITSIAITFDLICYGAKFCDLIVFVSEVNQKWKTKKFNFDDCILIFINKINGLIR